MTTAPVGTTRAVDIAKRKTPEDLLAMPDNNSAELVDGQIVEKNVSLHSSQTEMTLGGMIQSFLKENPVAHVYASTLGYRCFADDPEKIRKPDVSVIRIERLGELDGQDPGFVPFAPDLAVEVVSKNDTVAQVDSKVIEYHQAGCPLVWIADPQLRTITVHPREGQPAILSQIDEITAEQALPGFRCQVAEMFPAGQGRA